VCRGALNDDERSPIHVLIQGLERPDVALPQGAQFEGFGSIVVFDISNYSGSVMVRGISMSPPSVRLIE
jgi:hypothetical protein